MPLIFMLVSISGITGCSTPLMNIHDLESFKIDCNHKEDQIRFLKTQIPTSDQKMLAALSINLIGEFNAQMSGEKSQNRLIQEGYYGSVANRKIQDLFDQCPKVKTIYDYEAICPYDRHGRLICVHDLNGSADCDVYKCPEFRPW